MKYVKLISPTRIQDLPLSLRSHKPDVLAGLGYKPLEWSQLVVDWETQTTGDVSYVDVGDRIVGTVQVVDLTPEQIAAREMSFVNAARVDMLAELADKRWRVEVGGTTVGGVHVLTDRDTQAKLVAARIMAKEDPTYTVNWKSADGFVVMDAATIIAVADGVRAHVQAAFDREAALTAQIMAATTRQELSSIDISTGWAE